MARPPYVSIHIRSETPGRRVTADDIVRSIAHEIEAGRLAPGLRLPPVRELEHQLGMSKNTAQAAYDELTARGLIETRSREGVYVAATRGQQEPRFEPIGAAVPDFRPPVLRRDGAERDRNTIALSTVFIDPDLLPVEQLTECFRSVLKSPGLPPFYDAQGYRPLRVTIAERLRARGMDVDPDDVILTTGSQQGIDMVAKAMMGRTIATENPVYAHARFLFDNLGLQAVGLKLDPFGDVPLDAWAQQFEAHRPSLFYAITSYQNPTGYSYSTYELVQLLELSQHYGFAILEDDWGSDMLSGTEYRPTLRALGGSNVLYLNSFTKKLLPSLRIGYLVASEQTRETLVAAKRMSTLGNVAIVEAVVSEFLDRGYYDTHLKKLHDALDVRYRLCLEALRELMPKAVRWSTPGGGPTLWLEVPEGVDLVVLREKLMQQGVRIENSRDHFHGTPHLHGFRISYAFLRPEQLRVALERVAEALRKMMPTSG